MDDYEIFKQRMAALSGAIFLFGLAALFLMKTIFPAILVLIWITAIPAVLAEKGGRYGLWILTQAGIWLGGIPLLLETDFFFPGVLILAGMSALLVAIAPPDRLDRQHAVWLQERRERLEEFGKPKRKRDWQDLPLPPREDEDEMDDIHNDEPSAAGRSSQMRR
jgi:hypothetical protein